MAANLTTVEARAADENELLPVYVWQWPVRIAHWLLVLSLVVLSITGFYMHSPFIEVYSSRAWVMGTARFVHELFGFILIGVLMLRFYWFFAGNRWAHWRAFLPLTKRQWSGAGSMVSFYSFRRREPIPEIGHNPLAAMAYLTVLSLLILECLTGLVLYSVVVGNRTLSFLVGWIPRLVDIQYIRAAHFLLMFAFMAFLIHHVYSAVLVAMEQENGLMESIFSGWKFVSRRLLQEDAKVTSSGVSGKAVSRHDRAWRGKP